MDWLGPALVSYVVVAALMVSRRRLTKIRSLRAREPAALVRLIRSGAREALEAARACRLVESLEVVLLDVVLSGASTAARIADVNEHLGDLDRDLDVQRDVATRIARGTLLSGTLACVLGLTLTVAGPRGPAWAPSATSFLLGVAGWMAAMELDRRTRREAALARSEWDRVAVALGDRLTEGAQSATMDRPNGELPG